MRISSDIKTNRLPLLVVIAILTALVFAAPAVYPQVMAAAAPLQQPTSSSPNGSPKPDSHGIAVGNMDSSVKPGDDFYQYANGDWIKRTVLPPDRARIGVFSA
ncbi:MAG TPA: hypothetical protein VJ723_06890, partial [Candidatus Angelobacter sp.]|nr:hypothetical protein [Candidatus Angelobacter sp.]